MKNMYLSSSLSTSGVSESEVEGEGYVDYNTLLEIEAARRASVRPEISGWY